MSVGRPGMLAFWSPDGGHNRDMIARRCGLRRGELRFIIIIIMFIKQS